jgi:Flp pilus assembly pilin Flp
MSASGIREFWRDQRGQDLIEYALLVAVVAITCGAALVPVTPTISVIFSKIVSVVEKNQ